MVRAAHLSSWISSATDILLTRWITGRIGIKTSCGQSCSKNVKPKITAGHVVPPTRTMTYLCDFTILLANPGHHSSEILTVSVPVIMCCRSPSMLLPRYLSLIPHAGSRGNVEVPPHTSPSRKLLITGGRTSTSLCARVLQLINKPPMNGQRYSTSILRPLLYCNLDVPRCRCNPCCFLYFLLRQSTEYWTPSSLTTWATGGLGYNKSLIIHVRPSRVATILINL